jgi:hypothetical protein
MPVPEAVKAMFAAELDTVTVVDFTPAEVGVKESCPVVQVLPAVRTAFAVQVPSASENSASEEANGVAPKVTVPPCAVIVTVPQVPEVLIPCVAEQESEVGLKVKYARAVPETLKLVPVPEVVLTVTVSDSAPAVVGVKLIGPVWQVLPALSVELAVQVPKATVKSVESEFENGVADKVTGPVLAVRVTLPVQVVELPTLVAAHVIVPLDARVP